MLDNKQWSLIFLLFILVGFSGWWLLTHQQQKVKHQLINNTPDSFAEVVDIVNMDNKGMPSSHFYAESMVHYPQGDITLAEKPALIVYMGDQQPWYITAEQGKAIQGDKVIELWKNVQFKQPAAKDEPESLILTEAFTFWPNKNLGRTDKEVTLLQPGVKVTGRGLIADTLTGKVSLLNDVRSSYVAQN